MQNGFGALVVTHARNQLAGLDSITLGNQPLAIVRISRQHTIGMLDDDQFAVADQPVAAVNDLAACSRPD